MGYDYRKPSVFDYGDYWRHKLVIRPKTPETPKTPDWSHGIVILPKTPEIYITGFTTQEHIQEMQAKANKDSCTSVTKEDSEKALSEIQELTNTCTKCGTYNEYVEPCIKYICSQCKLREEAWR